MLSMERSAGLFSGRSQHTRHVGVREHSTKRSRISSSATAMRYFSISIFNNSAAGFMSHEIHFPDYKEEKGSGAEDRAKGKEALSTPVVEGRKRCARV